MKTKNRTLILLRILSKSDQILDDIVQLGLQIYPSKTSTYTPLDKIYLLGLRRISTDKWKFDDYQNALIEQLKEPAYAAASPQ